MTRTHSSPPAVQRKPSNYPALSFSEAMNLKVKTEQGERRIATLSAGDFARYIELCLSQYTPTKEVAVEALSACKRELLGLDYQESLARFFALDTLSQCGVPLTPFFSRGEA